MIFSFNVLRLRVALLKFHGNKFKGYIIRFDNQYGFFGSYSHKSNKYSNKVNKN